MSADGLAEDWWRGAVIYQIYPRSFRDLDGDGVGDLRGIIEKLDYVASLGVDGIWLSPFFRSPMKDFGYDVSDYLDVDPLFGALADFDALLERAHGLGLKVIIDQVWSHTSDRHPWFEASRDPASDKADWYVWADPKPDGSPPNNWLASFGGPSWTWSPKRRQYYFHNFLPEQPDLNYWAPAVREAIRKVARFWLDRGVDGFRLDVINYLAQDSALTDNPVAEHRRAPATATQYQKHIHDRSQPLALAFVEDVRRLMNEYPAKMTVGEIFDEEPLARQQEYTAPGRLHTAYSFYFLQAVRATPKLFAGALESWSDAAGWPSWSLGNHDVARFATRLGRGDPALTRLLLAVLMCLRGTIFLYQGEELGLPQAEIPFGRLQDPFAIAAYDGSSGRDGARTPMPWTPEEPSAGFSSNAVTWLPMDRRHPGLSVALQEKEPSSLLAFTRRLIALRRDSPALRHGTARVTRAEDGLLAFEREAGSERLLCAFDLSGEGRTIEIEAGADLMLDVGAKSRLEGVELQLGVHAGAVVRLDTSG